MTEQPTPNFEKQLVMPEPDAGAINGPQERSAGSDNTRPWAFISDVTETGNGYNVTVTGISNSRWYFLHATDSNNKRVTWEWCSNNQQVTLKCDPNRVAWINVAWQDGALGGWNGIVYTSPSWWR